VDSGERLRQFASLLRPSPPEDPDTAHLKSAKALISDKLVVI
jgi:hypothetical protein